MQNFLFLSIFTKYGFIFPLPKSQNIISGEFGCLWILFFISLLPHFRQVRESFCELLDSIRSQPLEYHGCSWARVLGGFFHLYCSKDSGSRGHCFDPYQMPLFLRQFYVSTNATRKNTGQNGISNLSKWTGWLKIFDFTVGKLCVVKSLNTGNWRGHKTKETTEVKDSRAGSFKLGFLVHI